MDQQLIELNQTGVEWFVVLANVAHLLDGIEQPGAFDAGYCEY